MTRAPGTGSPSSVTTPLTGAMSNSLEPHPDATNTNIERKMARRIDGNPVRNFVGLRMWLAAEENMLVKIRYDLFTTDGRERSKDGPVDFRSNRPNGSVAEHKVYVRPGM